MITKTERYLVVENFFLSKILERAQFETSDPARKTMWSVSGIEKEKDQLEKQLEELLKHRNE